MMLARLALGLMAVMRTPRWPDGTLMTCESAIPFTTESGLCLIEE